MDRPPKAKAIERLRKALDQAPELKQSQRGSPEFKKWYRNTQVAITNAFGNNSLHIADFNKISFSLSVFVSGTPESQFQRAYVRGLESAESVLQSMIEEIEEYWEDESQKPATSAIDQNGQIDSKEVFIVHGRDNEAKETIARFLEQLELIPIILHEQSSQGSTVIEKFERHAQPAFTVVLLTPDDVGALQGEENNLKPRARQNVIFELGFFIGRLGRNRVCALTKGEVEIPSDYAGVVYIPLDGAGGWKMKLGQELKAAGLDFNADRLLSPSS